MSVFPSTCRECIWTPHPVWTLWRREKHLECAGYGNTTIRSVFRILVIVSAVLSWFRSGSKNHSFVILNIFVSLSKLQVTVKFPVTLLDVKALLREKLRSVCLKTMCVGKYLGLRRFEAGGRLNSRSIVIVQAT